MILDQEKKEKKQNEKKQNKTKQRSKLMYLLIDDFWNIPFHLMDIMFQQFIDENIRFQ